MTITILTAHDQNYGKDFIEAPGIIEVAVVTIT